MTLDITRTGHSRQQRERDVQTSALRGWRRRCPACGDGRLYARYLTVADTCEHCGEAMHHHLADDAPPYFTMLIVGHVIVGGVLTMEQTLQPDLWIQMALWAPLTILLSLWLLPRIKGAIIGYQWALRMHGFGNPDADTAASDPIR